MILEDIVKADAKEQEQKLFRELDKGIDDLEAGRLTPHDEAMRKIRENIRTNAV